MAQPSSPAVFLKTNVIRIDSDCLLPWNGLLPEILVEKLCLPVLPETCEKTLYDA